MSQRLNSQILIAFTILALSSQAHARPTSSNRANHEDAIGSSFSESFFSLLNKGQLQLGGMLAQTRLEDLISGRVTPPLDNQLQLELNELPEDYHQDEIHQDDWHIPNLEQPVASFLVNVASLLHNLRELFVDVAMDELKTTETTPSLMVEPLRVSNTALEVIAKDDETVAPVSDLEADPHLPGEFSPSTSSTNLVDPNTPKVEPRVDVYNALGLSSLLATLCIIGVIVGRQYLINSSAQSIKLDVDLEKGPMDQDGSETDETDEKLSWVIETVPESEAEQVQAENTLALLIDIAKAAASNSVPQLILDESDPPEAVKQALESVRVEMDRSGLMVTPKTSRSQLTPYVSPSYASAMSSPSAGYDTATESPSPEQAVTLSGNRSMVVHAPGQADSFPPIHLSRQALEIALTLPATEWIFQFIIVFIGWFGFWMAPVNRPRR